MDYKTYKGAISPEVKGNILSIFNMQFNILIVNRNLKTEYLLSLEEFSVCKKLWESILCNM